MSYQDKLKDPRWQRKRLEVMKAAGFACEDCHRKDLELQVHHCAYIPRYEPWQYDNELLMCLCPDCHQQRQSIEDAARVEMGKILRCVRPENLRNEAWALCESAADRWRNRCASAFSTP